MAVNVGIPKGDISRKSNLWIKTKKTTGKYIKKTKKVAITGAASLKKWGTGLESKLTPQQRLLGKRLPKALWKTAKWAWKAPVSAGLILAAPSVIKGLHKRDQARIYKHRDVNPWSKKGRWMG